MSPHALIALAISLLVSAGQTALRPDAPIKCESCDEWNVPIEGFKVFGNTYYVGTAGLSALLITSDQGHILLDGGLTQSAPLIAANIVKLGFKVEDIKLILNSRALRSRRRDCRPAAGERRHGRVERIRRRGIRAR